LESINSEAKHKSLGQALEAFGRGNLPECRLETTATLQFAMSCLMCINLLVGQFITIHSISRMSIYVPI
jgi:hypothetical protein